MNILRYSAVQGPRHNATKEGGGGGRLLSYQTNIYCPKCKVACTVIQQTMT